MKLICNIIVSLFLPSLLLSQNSIPNPLLRGPLKNPYLYSYGSQRVPQNILKIHQAFSKFSKYFDAQNPQNSAMATVKQKLDSVINIPDDVSFPARKSAFQFNANGAQTDNWEYVWDEAASTWYYVSRAEWKYDANRFLKEYITYYGDELSWFNELKFENIYDGNYRLITINAYGWNETTNQWDLGSKIENTYNAENRLTTVILSEWDVMNNKWNPSTKTEYEHEPNGFISTITYYSWAEPNWERSSKEEFTYYVFGKELGYTFYIWDGSGDWADYYQTESFYDANRKLIIHTEYVWDVISVIYVKFKKSEYNYDQFDNMSSAIFSNWVKQLQDFIFVSKEDCIYNNVHPGKDLLIPGSLKFSQTTNRISDLEIYFNSMLTNHNHFLHNGTRYVDNAKRTFYYSPITITTSEDIHSNSVSLYPNPTNQIIKVSGLESESLFTLYNINGTKQFSKLINNDELISIKELSKGMYLYKVVGKSNMVKAGKLFID